MVSFQDLLVMVSQIGCIGSLLVRNDSISLITGLCPISRDIVLPDHHRPYIGPQNTLKKGPKKDPKRVILDHPESQILGFKVSKSPRILDSRCPIISR